MNNKVWFKRIGLPISWEGWLLTVLWLGSVSIGTYLATQSSVSAGVVPLMLAMTMLFALVFIDRREKGSHSANGGLIIVAGFICLMIGLCAGWLIATNVRSKTSTDDIYAVRNAPYPGVRRPLVGNEVPVTGSTAPVPTTGATTKVSDTPTPTVQ